MRKRPLLLALCVFWLGIALRNTGNLWLLFAFAIICVYDLKPLEKRIGRGIVLLLVFLLGMIHMNKNLVFREEYLSKLTDGDEVAIWGEIYKQEHLDDALSRVWLTDCYVSINNVTFHDISLENQEYIPCNNIMVYTSSADYQVGTILKVNGQFHNFSTATNEGNFDSRGFYQSQKVDFYVEAEEIDEKDNALTVPEKWILDFKENIGKVYDQCLPKKWAGVMKGIVLGDKTELDETLKELFTLSGIVHILTVSGLHVSVLGRGLYQFLRKRRWGFLFSGIAAGIVLVGYGNLTGNGVSTQRAIGMMFLFMLAQWVGRSYDMLNSLGGICLLLLWENPFLTEYTGLWFSGLALIGVGWVGKYLSEKAGGTKGLWMSLGVTLATLPVVSYCYYEVPVYSTVLNWVVIPLLTPVFVCGAAGGIVGVFLPGAGKVILYPCHFILWLYEAMCEWVGELPFSSIITGQPPVWLMVVYYILLGIGILWVKVQNEKENACKWFAVKKLLLGAGCFVLLLGYKEKREFEINFLDVGQGDGIHIAVGEHNFFIDGGSVDVRNVGEYRILPYLKANGISEIDYWFVTHADTDHISGLLEVMESGYSIQNLVLSKAMPEDEKYEKLVSTAKSHDINICYMKTGDAIQCDDAVFKCLYPGNEKIEDKNEASLVLQLSLEERKALFTGDISSEVELVLIEQDVLSDVWLYKAAHHGSKHSNSTELLEVITPEVSIVSCSSTNVYGHPSPEAVGRLEMCGAEMYYTMTGGQITIRKWKEDYQVVSFMQNNVKNEFLVLTGIFEYTKVKKNEKNGIL